MPVTVVHFNPLRRGPGPVGMIFRRRLNNFGDVIGPVLVKRIVAELGLKEPADDRRLLAVGSIARLAEPGDTIWGSGINGKSMEFGGGTQLDVRAVRGPRTRDLLLAAGVSVPAVYGDPALLWSRFWPRSSYVDPDGSHEGEVTIVPNFHDMPAYSGDGRVIDPLCGYQNVIARIARSGFVCGSSLHGIVLAESFGIPARLISSQVEPQFKYDDYFFGTGRPKYRAAATVDEALRMGGEEPPNFDSEALLAAFPRDLWKDS